MKLYLLRHGLAVDRGTPEFENDELRPLTPAGRRQLRRSTAAFAALDLRFDLILCSPLTRARQTAKIVAAAMRFKGPVKATNELKPGNNPKALIQALNTMKPCPKSVLLVGHEPDLSRLISLLVTGHIHAGLALKKGGLAKLKLERLAAGRCATLAWLLTPKHLLAMV